MTNSVNKLNAIVKRIEFLMEAETDPHKRNQYRQIIRQTIDKLTP